MKADDFDLEVGFQLREFVEDKSEGFFLWEAACSGADDGEGDRSEPLLLGEVNGVADGGTNGKLAGSPPAVDARDVDDGAEGKAACVGENGVAERNGAFGKLLEGRVAAALFDGAGNTVRPEQPPRNDVAIPGVDDGVHFLIE